MTNKALDTNVLLQDSTFGRTIAELSAKYDLPCTVEVRDRVPSGAQTKPWRRRIEVEAALLAAPAEVQGQTSAHEFGHLMSARRRGPRFYPWAYYGWAAAALALFVTGGTVIPGAVATTVRPYLADGLFPTALVVIGAVLLLAALSLGCGCIALWRLARHTRPLEVEADTFAKNEGYPVTAAVVERMLAEEQGIRLPKVWRSHPAPQDRLNVDS